MIKNNIIYHYSNKRFDSIKSLRMLEDEGITIERDERYTEEYRNTASFMMRHLSVMQIKLFRKHGFVNYGDGPLYEYKIDLLENEENFYIPLDITSIPDEWGEFRYGDWKVFLESVGIDIIRMESDIRYWEKVKLDYRSYINNGTYYKLLDAYVARVYGLMTVKNYVGSKKIHEIIMHYDEYIKKNLKEGRKNQYASYIPHLHTRILNPIVPVEVNKII